MTKVCLAIFTVRPRTILTLVSGLISTQALCLNDLAYNCLIHSNDVMTYEVMTHDVMTYDVMPLIGQKRVCYITDEVIEVHELNKGNIYAALGKQEI